MINNRQLSLKNDCLCTCVYIYQLLQYPVDSELIVRIPAFKWQLYMYIKLTVTRVPISKKIIPLITQKIALFLIQLLYK